MAQAALVGNYTGATFILDGTGDNAGGNVMDILSLSMVKGTGIYSHGTFFLMTVAAGPQLGAGNFAESYMLNFNNAAGGSDGNSPSSYVAIGLTGIDMIIDAHYQSANGLVNNHYHQYTFPADSPVYFSTVGIGSVGASYWQSGADLEWFVPDSLLTGATVVYGSTLDTGAPTTYDITGPLTVPEPTSMALLALGMVALGLRRKVRK